MIAATSSFWAWMSELSPHERGPIVFFAIMAIIAITGLVCLTVKTMFRNRLEHTLKRELLDRGMSADEIATIVRATPSKDYVKQRSNG